MAFIDDLVTGYAAHDHLDTGAGWSIVGGTEGLYILWENSAGSGMPSTNSGSGSGATAYQCTDQGSANNYAQFMAQNLAADATTIIATNCVDKNTGVGIRVAGTGSIGTRLCKIVSGTITDLTGGTSPSTQIDTTSTFRVEHDGAGNYSLWVDSGSGFVQSGSSQFVSDAEVSHSNTRSGAIVTGGSTSLNFINFEAGALGGGGTTLSLNAASLGFTPESIALRTTLGLGYAALSFSGQGPTIKLTLRLGSASFAITGQSITILSAILISLGAAAFGVTGQALDIIIGLSLGAASFAVAGQQITLILSRLLQLGTATFAIIGRRVTISVAGVAGVITAFLQRWRRRGRR